MSERLSQNLRWEPLDPLCFHYVFQVVRGPWRGKRGRADPPPLVDHNDRLADVRLFLPRIALPLALFIARTMHSLLGRIHNGRQTEACICAPHRWPAAGQGDSGIDTPFGRIRLCSEGLVDDHG